MKIEYSKRAIADLRSIATYCLASDNPEMAAKVEARIRDVVARVARSPDSAPPVVQRPGMRVVLVLRYPYKIFYRVRNDRIRIVHIRHTARRPWRGADEPPP